MGRSIIALTLSLGLLWTSPAWAQPADPALPLIEFGQLWAHQATAMSDIAPSPPLSDWTEIQFPVSGRYAPTSKQRKSPSVIDMRPLDKLDPDPWTRSDQDVAEETVFWFVSTFELESPDEVASLLFEARFIGGFVVYLNGTEILRHRLDRTNRYEGFSVSSELPSFVREGRQATGQRAFRGLDPASLVAGTNVLAIRAQRQPGTADRSLFLDARLQAFLGADFVKAPYLQHATQERITIMFESTFRSTPFVEYGTGTSLTETATTPTAGGTLHEVVLTGLQPDTRYYYRVRAEPLTDAGGVSETLWSDVYYFRTAPADDAPVRFLAYGDNRSQPAVHTALIERMLTEDAAFVINTGDLTESGVDYRQWQTEFFEPARPLMVYLPMWTSLGNHDGNHISYFENFDLPGNESWYRFRWGVVEFFALNTVDSLKPKSDQYTWLDDALASSDADWKVVFFHHPPFSCTPSRLPGFGPVRDHIVPLFEKHGVQLVVSGHDHLYAHAENNGIHYVISGGGGAWTYPTQVEPPNLYCEQVHHYTVVEADASSIFLKAIDVDGGEIDAFAIHK